MCHWSSSRFLVHHHHCALIKTPLKYLGVARRLEDSVMIVLQDQSLGALREVIDVAPARVSKPKAQDVGLGSRVGLGLWIHPSREDQN